MTAGRALFETDEMGRTPLHVACLRGHASVAEVLLQHGALVNIKDKTGCTALHLAATNGHADVVGVLLANGAKIGAKTANGDNAFELAYDNENYDVVAYLLDSYKRVSEIGFWSASVILLDAVKACHVPLVISSLTKGADVNIGDHGNTTPLHIACELNNIKMAGVLLDNGARVDVINYKYETPLHHACLQGGIEIANELLKSGANPNAGDSERVTPLHTASRLHHGNMITLLVESGADISVKDSQDLTPILTLFKDRPCHSTRGFLTGFMHLRKDIKSLIVILNDSAFITYGYQTEKKVLLLAMLTANGYVTQVPSLLLIVLSLYKDRNYLEYLVNEIGFSLRDSDTYPRLKELNTSLPDGFLRQPPSLQAICRNRMRVHLRKKFEPIDEKINRLRLPKSMKRYLKFEDEIAAVYGEVNSAEEL